MEYNSISNNENRNFLINNLKKIKSNYILSKIYYNISKKKSLEIIKYNKKVQNRLNLSIKDYKNYYETFTPIELEIIPSKNKFGKFININEKDKLYYNLYLNGGGYEIKNKFRINGEDKATKIKIIIDYQIISFEKLFEGCYCIESIIFKKFYRNNINNMSYMFYGCPSLKELNLNNFNTNNVIDMSMMFYGCSSLKELNLYNFNTNNVTDMSMMFNECSSLKKLNISNFNTNNVKYMNLMFDGCPKGLKNNIITNDEKIKEEMNEI